MPGLGSFRKFAGLRLGLFCIFWSSTVPPRLRLGLFRVIEAREGAEIGFVSHFLVFHRSAVAGIGFVSRNRGAVGVRLGSFCENVGWWDTWYTRIGFVSHFLGVADGGGGGNWVRFA